MKIKVVTALVIATALFYISCGGGDSTNASSGESSSQPAAAEDSNPSSYDPNRGEGKFDEKNVGIGPLDAAMAAKGKSIAETKCFSCHKTSEEKLVGPGWKGVTTRRAPHWIMNFITNPDPMIDKDPEVQAQLELCLVRMPNQNLAEQEARDIVEFMRQNDGTQ
ncbi:MAG: c-type cytochrome [Chitinophagaceae bacterium]|nr:c-type cytochrome [Chitinophagaceae bacterium]